MQMVLLIAATFASIWLLLILIQTILYGAMTCATGIAGLFIANCVDSGSIFTLGDMQITMSGMVAFLLFVTMFKLGARFIFELKIAYMKIMHPFSGK